MAKIVIEVDTEEVIGRGDIHWEKWCESLSDLLYAAEDGRPVAFPSGVISKEPALAAEREACAKVAEDLASNTQQLLLHAGEMEHQELRTAKAVIKLVAALIRGRG